jgi:hypothetical protein
MWLAAAFAEVRDIHEYYVFDGIAHARRVADHPSKIIPAIFKHCDAAMERSRKSAALSWDRHLHAGRSTTAIPDHRGPAPMRLEERREIATGFGELLADLDKKLAAE